MQVSRKSMLFNLLIGICIYMCPVSALEDEERYRNCHDQCIDTFWKSEADASWTITRAFGCSGSCRYSCNPSCKSGILKSILGFARPCKVVFYSD